jgi:hypothetical protein
MDKIVFSVVESPLHPNFSSLYDKYGYREIRLGSIRKAISELKRNPPDLIVADFLYGYGNNYAGVNVCNLDVFLYSVQRYADAAKIIVLVDKEERKFVDKLADLFPLHDVLVYPVAASAMEQALDKLV